MCNTQYKYFFTRIPKSASNAIGEILGPCKQKAPYSKDKNRNRYHSTLKDWEIHPNFNEFTKIASIRNPWDRIVSLFYQLIKNGRGVFPFKKLKPNMFKDFVQAIANDEVESSASQLHWLGSEEHCLTRNNINRSFISCIQYDTNNLLVDFIIRCENLEEDTKKICNTQKKILYRFV